MAGSRHVLVNRDLFREFAALLAAAEWDVALLQEVPPRWADRLAAATGADARVALTSRNWLRPLTFPVARVRPHLAGSWEGGCNLILVRRSRRRGGALARSGRRTSEAADRPGVAITDHRRATLTWRPERRVVSMVRLAGGICLANLHASTGKGADADIMRAAELSVEWAGATPLVLGGDFNARPGRSDVYSRLESEFGLTGITGDDSIDHLLVRGAGVVEPGTAWPPERRDVPDPDSDLLVRLSDHAPVTARIVTSA